MREVLASWPSRLAIGWVCVCFVACSSEGRHPTDGGVVGQVDLAGAGGDGGVGADGCSDEAKLVYLVDSNNDFLSFRPDTLEIKKIGTLNCPALDGTPYSMGVDRSPTAWVLYSDGELFKVSTQNASCEATSFQLDQKGLLTFGMGFASNSAGSTDETLYIAGGEIYADGTPSKFATVGFPSLTVSTKGMVSGWPELTGTGEGKLWGFFPSAATPKVMEITKSNGADGTTFPLPALAGTPSSWAFAFWGGDFFVFLKRDGEASTSVYRVKGGTGALSTALKDTGRNIVGAGVSTCAPTVIQ